MRYVLGISGYYHDSAAALIGDGAILAAAQEERFTRIKHDPAFPQHAIRYCLEEAGIGLDEVEHIVFYDKPLLKFERLLETYLASSPRGFNSFRMAIPVWLREKLFLKDLLAKELAAIDGTKCDDRLLFTEHHFSHAASAFFPSPFDEAVVLTMDGVGEWATTSVSIGRGNVLDIVREIHFPHSLGLLYSAFTYYVGFKVNSGEYKLMGLAPYGEPRFHDAILDHLIDQKEDGSFRLDQSYFNYVSGLTMTNDRFAELFGRAVRRPEQDPIEQFHMDIAASIQSVTEEIILRLTRSLASEFDIPNLCLAGGVALNCVANGKVLRDGAFSRLWIQPAAGDAGGALGAALGAWHKHLQQPRVSIGQDAMAGSFLGPRFGNDQIADELNQIGARFKTKSEDDLIADTAQALAEGKAVGWFQGRMEFGPRALGNRSILGDPRSPDMQKTLNLKIKFRESFRPFAPSVLSEHVSDWFDLGHLPDERTRSSDRNMRQNKEFERYSVPGETENALDEDSPYMLIVADIASNRRLEAAEEQSDLFGIDKLNIARSSIPAVTHVDNSARVQTVHQDTNPRFHALLSKFHDLTGCPVLVNTSFNVRGEPIVCTPTDAFRCFMGTHLDMLVVGDCVMHKADQDAALSIDYAQEFELD